jgi:hypothetical protein
VVRALKAAKAPKEEIGAAVTLLKELKAAVGAPAPAPKAKKTPQPKKERRPQGEKKLKAAPAPAPAPAAPRRVDPSRDTGPIPVGHTAYSWGTLPGRVPVGHTEYSWGRTSGPVPPKPPRATLPAQLGASGAGAAPTHGAAGGAARGTVAAFAAGVKALTTDVDVVEARVQVPPPPSPTSTHPITSSHGGGAAALVAFAAAGALAPCPARATGVCEDPRGFAAHPG